MKININNKTGMGVVEIIVASTIGVLLFASVSGFLNQSLKMAIDDMHKAEALSLAKSQLEEARAMRDEDKPEPGADPKQGWNNVKALKGLGAYHFTQNGTGPYSWGAAAGYETTGKYIVSFTVSSVQRSNFGKGDIVASGGTVDAETVKITSNVSWISSEGAQSISLFEYLTNFK